MNGGTIHAALIFNCAHGCSAEAPLRRLPLILPQMTRALTEMRAMLRFGQEDLPRCNRCQGGAAASK